MRKSAIFFLFITLMCLAKGQAPTNTPAQVIDSLLRSNQEQGIFNGVALVADQGEIILHNAYGIADLVTKKPLQQSDRFYIASVTKQFTSALIFIFQQEGLLNIHDPISTHLPEFKSPTFDSVSLYHLLTHTSGIYNYTSDPEFSRSKVYSEEAFLEMLARPLVFAPGTGWEYSNSGYYLLGIIAQRVAGKPYGTLLREKIFAPLAMHDTGFDTTWITENRAYGYLRTIDGLRPMPDYALSSLFSSGGVYTTAADFFKWEQALYTDKILSDSAKKVMFTPFKNDYGCGWYVKRGVDEQGNEFERHFHGGWIQGYHAFILRRIPQRQVIILLDNGYSQELQTLKNRIWSALIGDRVRPVKQKLSNLLFDAAAGDSLVTVMEDVAKNWLAYEARYQFEEYDINKVAYRLMESGRFAEANLLMEFNIAWYPLSWNAYDSMGELQLEMGNMEESRHYYQKSLELNPDSFSGKEALERIRRELGE